MRARVCWSLFAMYLTCLALPAELQPVPRGSQSTGVPRKKDRLPLKCSVRVDQADVRKLVISLANTGSMVVNVEPPWFANLHLSATRNGSIHKSLRSPKDIVDGGGIMAPVKPNQTSSFFVDLNGWYDLSVPGEYEIVGTYSVVPVVYDKGDWSIYHTTKFQFNVCFVVTDPANKSLQPTATAVMPPAAQEIMPAVAVAEH